MYNIINISLTIVNNNMCPSLMGLERINLFTQRDGESASKS